MNKHIAFSYSMPKSVAAVTALALLAWAFGLPTWIHQARAANVADFSDTLSDSDLGVDAMHTITFTTSNAMTSGQDFAIYFDQGSDRFDFTGVLDSDLQSGESGFTAVVPGSCSGAASEIELSVGAGDYIQGNVCAGDTVAAGAITIQVGAANFVNNPAAEDTAGFVISLQGTGATPIADEGDTRVYIIDDVTVTAEVNTIFEFSINPVANGTLVDGVDTTTGTSTATSVPFGILAPNTPNVIAQELRVNTNAYNGFAVTVEADQTLTAGNTATIDTFIDGLDTAVSTAWQGPAGTFSQLDTYGHWGLTSDDSAVAAGDFFNNAEYVGNFVGNPVEVFYHDAAVVESAGQGIGTTTVAYKAEIMELQEAAKDYTATLTYVATPVF